ncbi:MAG: peptidase [Gemmatales bacterium]|nr:MAG: peptidase [Gemmatales bacterium]
MVVHRDVAGKTEDVTPPPFNARSRVHEYGGASYTVSDGVIYFTHFDDHRLYRLRPGQHAEAITPNADLRYADAVVDRRRQCLYCVREDHTQPGEPTNTVVQVFVDRENPGRIVAAGHDFYSSPRLSPDGRHLCWLAWNHPNMPWDGCELWLADLDDEGMPRNARPIAGGDNESIFQPEWSPDGQLYFVSDRSGWWNLYRYDAPNAEALCPVEAEFGRPQWVLGIPTYAFAGARIVCSYTQKGFWHLALLDPDTKKLDRIDTGYTDIHSVRANDRFACFIASSPTESAAVVRLDLSTRRPEVLRRSSATVIDPAYLSHAQPIEFPTEKGLTAHAFYYPPKNRDYVGPPNEKPPLLVRSHGGPTSATSSGLKADIQFWTSRGIAVLDVNYGGSTGYGREYRQRLDGAWGIVDVDDCVHGARFLIERGDVDPERIAIRGGSAGGYTTLAALAFRRFFKAGASYYGVSDLEALAKDTHKFESRYLDRLIGPYPAAVDLYRQRSPIHFADRLSCPVILFQGLQDKVVPPNQAEIMVDALKAKRLPVAYVAFAGEQHGFRRAENIKRAFENELYFYGRIFGFEPADSLTPVAIENLP